MVLLPMLPYLTQTSEHAQCPDNADQMAAAQHKRQDWAFYYFPYSGIDKNAFAYIVPNLLQICKSTTVPSYSYIQCFSDSDCINQI